jgi:hypothetical protein
MRRIRSGCCGRAADGHAAVLPRPAMNSRRRMLDPSHWLCYRGRGRRTRAWDRRRGRRAK